MLSAIFDVFRQWREDCRACALDEAIRKQEGTIRNQGGDPRSSRILASQKRELETLTPVEP